MPASTCACVSRPVSARKRSGRSVSRLSVTRCSPARAQRFGVLGKQDAVGREREIADARIARRAFRTRLGKSRRSSGSPPVRRTSSTPREVNTSTSRAISSNVRSSCRGQPDVILLRHAVVAAQVAAIGHRDAQAAQRAAQAGRSGAPPADTSACVWSSGSICLFVG